MASLVYLAWPATRNHIAHYIRLDKAEQKFGGDCCKSTTLALMEQQVSRCYADG
jgi:hypothetical protein